LGQDGSGAPVVKWSPTTLHDKDCGCLGRVDQRWLPMDFYNPDDWTKLETAFTSAPPWALIATSGTIGGLLGWFLQSTKSAGKIGGLKGQIDELNVRIDSLKDRNLLTEERMKFTAEKAAIAGQIEDELKKRIQSLEMGIADKADIASLSALATEVKSGFAKLATANNEVSSSLSVVLRITEEPDVASVTVDNGALKKLDHETLKKFQGMGQLLDPDTLERLRAAGKGVSPETLEKLRGVGKPFINVDGDKKLR
jgi:hypothetical protein